MYMLILRKWIDIEFRKEDIFLKYRGLNRVSCDGYRMLFFIVK